MCQIRWVFQTFDGSTGKPGCVFLKSGKFGNPIPPFWFAFMSKPGRLIIPEFPTLELAGFLATRAALPHVFGDASVDFFKK